MAIEAGDRVRFEYTGRLRDGEVFDTSRESVAEESGLAAGQPDREYAPLTVEIGNGRIIEALDEGLRGMEEGEEATITAPPEEAYGERDPENVLEYDLPEFREALQGADPEVGMHVQTQQGGTGEVIEIGETVRVDFNHELAGETLEFEVEILDVN